MVLQPGGCGRVGHRRTHFEGEGPNEYASLLDQVVQAERECLVGAFTHLTHQALACNECEREERRVIRIGVAAAERSEERRVGKERRTRRATWNYKRTVDERWYVISGI